MGNALTETEAKTRGIPVQVVKVPTSMILRTATIDENQGFMKVLIDPNSQKIRGFTMIGPEAGEVLTLMIRMLLLSHH